MHETNSFIPNPSKYTSFTPSNTTFVVYHADSALLGAPGVLSSPFIHSLASPLTAPYAGGVAGGIPGLGGFALGQAAPGLRGLGTPGLALATVLLVSNLNEEVGIMLNSTR